MFGLSMLHERSGLTLTPDKAKLIDNQITTHAFPASCHSNRVTDLGSFPRVPPGFITEISKSQESVQLSVITLWPLARCYSSLFNCYMHHSHQLPLPEGTWMDSHLAPLRIPTCTAKGIPWGQAAKMPRT